MSGSSAESCQFVSVSEHATALAAGHTVNRQTAFFFPTIDGALIAAEKSGNFFPRIQAPTAVWCDEFRHMS